jgi:acyl-CoA dehydrogenase
MTEPAMAIEALCAGATLSQLFMRNPIFGGVTLTKCGSPEMKRDLLLTLVTGKASFAMARTEPYAGTNAIALKAFACADDNRWRLSGQNIWFTCLPQATKLVVARTHRLDDVQHRTDAISLLMIDVDRAGLTQAAIEKAGTSTLPSSRVFCDDVMIEGAELDELDHGFHQLLAPQHARDRHHRGPGRHGRTRQQAPGRLREGQQGLQRRADRLLSGDPVSLAEPHIKAECARLMNNKAATLCDVGKHYGCEANMGKWLAGQAAALATDRAMKALGGVGYSNEYHVGRLWRDTRLFKFAPVSEEMVQNDVAQRDLGMPQSY